MKRIFVALTVVIFLCGIAAMAYCGWGGPEPSKNMGSDRSFSFYSDQPGNAAALWMQPGAGPSNPVDEFWFDNSGVLNVSGGVNVGSAPLGANTMAAFGDSITAGSEDETNITWPNQYSLFSGQGADNEGVGGQTSSQIAVRMNAYAGQSEQTFTSAFTIPTSGTVAVTFPTGFEPAYNDPSWLGVTVSLSFTVGGVNYEGTVVDNGSHVYNFTPNPYPSSPVSVPSGTAYTVQTGNLLNGCVAIEAGENNSNNSTQVLADTAAMVAKVQQTTSCYAVMSVLNAEYCPKGSTCYNWSATINSALASAYGSHYVDIRGNLIKNYNPNFAPDVNDYNNDIPPASLRAQDVSGTITNAMTDTTSCNMTFSNTWNTVGTNYIVTIDSEGILITGGSNGAWTCTRGYIGTATTHSAGASYTGIDPLHPGQNMYSPSNQNFQNGYNCIGSQMNSWYQGTSAFKSVLSAGSINQSKTSPQVINANLIKLTGNNGYLSNAYSGGWVFNNVSTLYGSSINNSSVTNLQAGWGLANFTGTVQAPYFQTTWPNEQYSLGINGLVYEPTGSAFSVAGDGSFNCNNKNMITTPGGPGGGTLGEHGFPWFQAWTDELVSEPQTFSALPACQSYYEGMIATIQDGPASPTWHETINSSNSGATGCSGAQCSTPMSLFCNGTNWTVAAY